MSPQTWTFDRLMQLELHGPDTYIGISPPYDWGRIYGGQVIAQALCAAADTVSPEHVVHSLHAYFILGGSLDEPVRYEVDRIRNGRSFTTRLVVARQSTGAILNLAASFHRFEDEVDAQTHHPPPDVPDPESMAEEGWGYVLNRRNVSMPHGTGRAITWVRVDDSVGGDPVRQAVALALASDTSAVTAARAVHPAGNIPPERHREVFMGASLDHMVWFHRPCRADDWMLVDFTSHGLIGARGLSIGYMFDRQGVHVATIAQEALLRERKPATP